MTIQLPTHRSDSFHLRDLSRAVAAVLGAAAVSAPFWLAVGVPQVGKVRRGVPQAATRAAIFALTGRRATT
jgi:hypothetical protein